MSGHQAPPPRPARARRLRACKRCHARRIKCDASVNGLPCANCRHTGSGDCSFIEFQRRRGSTGRFVSTAPQGHTRSPFPEAVAASSPDIPDSQSAESYFVNDKTVLEAGYGLDLNTLCLPAEQSGPVIFRATEKQRSHSSTSDKGVSDRQIQEPHKPLYKRYTGFIGESWYASFLLRASNNENDQLRRHVVYTSCSSGLSEVCGQAEAPGGATGDSWQDAVREQLPDDLPPRDLISGLMEAYFTRFHALFPILNQSEFLTAFRDGYAPITLLRCVLFIACVHCDMNIIHRMGYDSRKDAQDDLFNHARRCLEQRPEETRCLQIVCSFLLHFWWGQPSSVKDPIWWLANAIRLAQSIGMHRTTYRTRRTPERRAHAKRIWWCLYIRDRQVSLTAGVPMMINDLDCDIEELTPDDFPDETATTAQYVIAQASLCTITSTVYFCHLSPSRINLTADEEHRQNVEKEILSTLDLWYGRLPDGLRHEGHGAHLTVALRIIYNYWKIEFVQRLRRKRSDSESPSQTQDLHESIKFASRITRDVEDALMTWKPEHFPMITVTAIFAAMMTQYIAAGTSKADQKQLLIQKLRSNLRSLQQFEKCYVLARWIRNIFENIMRRQGRPQSPSPSPSPSNHDSRIQTWDAAQSASTEIANASHLDVVSNDGNFILSTGSGVDYFYNMLPGNELQAAGFPGAAFHG